MKKIFFLLLLFICVQSFSQSLQDGIKQLQYQKFQSAVNTFETLIKQNANDSLAVFWLGETYIKNKDANKAYNLFIEQKSLKNAAFIKIGLAHANAALGLRKEAELQLKNDGFDNASNVNSEMLCVAIGRAYVDIYKFEKAISFFTKAKQLNPSNPYNLIMLADVSIRNADGSAAYKYYTEAIKLDSNYAPAYFGLAKIYISQKNPSFYLPQLLKAVSKDSMFVPAWYELYKHAYYNDKSNAKKYYAKYLEVADKTQKQAYQLLVMDYNAKKYSNVITKAKELLADKESDVPVEFYKYVAYSYYVTKNNSEAYNNMLHYIDVQDSNKITNFDYYLTAQFAARLQKKDSIAIGILTQEFDRDTTTKNKLIYGNAILFYHTTKKDNVKSTIWKEKMLPLTKYNKVDMYNVGLSWYNIKEFGKADTIFQQFIAKYPKEFKGIYMIAGIKAQVDSTSQTGDAVTYFQQFVDSAKNNTTADYKPMLEQSYNYLGAYYLSRKEYAKALSYYNVLIKYQPSSKSLKSTINDLKKYLRDMEKYNKSKSKK